MVVIQTGIEDEQNDNLSGICAGILRIEIKLDSQQTQLNNILFMLAGKDMKDRQDKEKRIKDTMGDCSKCEAVENTQLG